MYATCLFCHAHLGGNEDVPTCLVGRRLAFDPARGRLWVVCTRCGCWNLTPLDERWEAIDRCEVLFRGTRLRVSTDNIALARLRSGLELVRIGPALFPEIAAWRYGDRLGHAAWRRGADERRDGLVRRGGRFLARQAERALAGSVASLGLSDDALLHVRIFRREHRVLARGVDDGGRPLLIRYRHLRDASLIRPDREHPWRLVVRHDGGVATLAETGGLRTAATLLAALNGRMAARGDVRDAVAKLDAAGDPDGFFTRVAALAMRTSWGRFPDAPDTGRALPVGISFAERLAVQLANRSFWARGGTGSEPETRLYRLPVVDRLALEMAANEDSERRAVEGELEALRDAWREAEEIAAIADAMFDDDVLQAFKARVAPAPGEPAIRHSMDEPS
ncbi:MAG TPA: hypothetical protein VF041_12100 [Gemmatimonadaceae bacterium]